MFSQILLSLDVLPREKIAGILDNAELKQNRLLYPFDYQVFSPKILSGLQGQEAPAVIVFAGAYEKEIVAQIRTLNQEAEIICSENFLKWQGEKQ